MNMLLLLYPATVLLILLLLVIRDSLQDSVDVQSAFQLYRALEEAHVESLLEMPVPILGSRAALGHRSKLPNNESLDEGLTIGLIRLRQTSRPVSAEGEGPRERSASSQGDKNRET